MKHFVVIANAYKDRNFALTNKIVAMSRLYPITSLSLRIYHRIRSVFLYSAEMVH